ncbi:hypothetical protein ACSSS7_001325 [Eimeria intestinalis]
MASSSSARNAERQLPPFAAELQGLPVVAAATFCGGECCNVVREGSVPVASRSAAEAAKSSGGSLMQQNDDPQLISKSLAAAEKAAPKSLLEKKQRKPTISAMMNSDLTMNEQLQYQRITVYSTGAPHEGSC